MGCHSKNCEIFFPLVLYVTFFSLSYTVRMKGIEIVR